MKQASPLLCLTALLLTAPLSASHAQDDAYNNAAIVNFESRLSTVEDQMRTLTGKTEQIDYGLRRLSQAMERLQSDTEMRLTKLEQIQQQMLAQQRMTTTSAQEAPPSQQQPAVQTYENEEEAPAAQQAAQARGTLGAIKVQNGRIVGGVNAPKATPLPKTPTGYGLTPQEQYDKAFGLLRQAQYDDAEKAFKSFIDKNPKDKLLDNAKYWYAETFYVRQKFSEAAVSFADAYQQDPKGHKAPDSLLKLGMALAALKKIPDACVTLDELKSKYPNASATIRARANQERTRLKCK